MARIGSLLISACLCGALVALSTAASAQQAMGNQPWNFTAQNRAGIAALIEQQENGTGGSGGGGSAYACGGGGTATATANYTCMILNNSTASIGASQASDGNQAATSDTETSVNGASEATLSTVIEEMQDE